jgi:hypothetical protein
MQSRRYTTRHVRRQQHTKLRRSKFHSREGIEFVVCRICGKHLFTHGTDRETYMLEYGLSPGKLCSKWFRLNHSSRHDYCPYSKREWIAALKKSTSSTAMFMLATCRSATHISINKVFGYSVIGVQPCTQQGSRQNVCGYGRIGLTTALLGRYRFCVKTVYLCIRHTF